MSQNKKSLEQEQIQEQLIQHNISQTKPKVEKCIFFKQILLKPNISKYNYMGSLLHYLVMPFIFVSVEVLQPILFQNKFNILPQNAGNQNSNVILADIMTKIIFAPMFGIFNDKFGRQKVLIYGVCIISLALSLMPLSNTIYPSYLLCRILYAHGAIAIATIPLLGDYVIDSRKGRASSINVFSASVGAILSSQLINQMLQKNFSIDSLYWSVAGLYFLLSMSYVFIIKRGVYNKLEQEKKQKQECSKIVKIGFQASFNPWILMGYITNFLGRGDSILLTLFLVLWSYNQGNQQNYHDSEIQANMLSGICYTVVMIFSIVYGVMFEKVSKFLVLGMMFFFTCLGCIMFTFAENPKGAYVYVTMVVLGIGLSGLYTAALYLVNKYAYTNYRGYITGLANIFSVLGITICVLGGYVVNQISFAFPFTMFGILSFFAMLALAYCYIQHNKKVQEYMNSQNNLSSQSTTEEREKQNVYLEDKIYEDDYCLNQKEDQLQEQC